MTRTVQASCAAAPPPAAPAREGARKAIPPQCLHLEPPSRGTPVRNVAGAMLEDSAILRARNLRRRAAAASPAAPAAEVARHGTRAMMVGETIGRVKTLHPDLGGWATG